VPEFSFGQTCDPAPSGLVSWWPAAGNAKDIAGTNNGTLKGGAIATAPGMVGNAFHFDGTNGYVQIPAINNATTNVNPMTNTDPALLGHYVSSYMAYLVCWYGSDSGVQPTNAAIKAYGHTHVGALITPSDAQTAFQAQLDALITWLDSH